MIKHILKSKVAPILYSFPIVGNIILFFLRNQKGAYYKWGKYISKKPPANFKITAGELKGLEVFDLEWDEISPIVNNSMEPVCTKLLPLLNIKDCSVLDIGASYGYYSLLLSKITGNKGKVYAFEPSIINNSRLYKNIVNNNISNVMIIPFAISNSSGFVRLSENKNAPWITHIADEDDAVDNRQICPTTSLDEFRNLIPKEHISFIKIDVEGFENNVLSGSINMLSIDRPLILCEIHSANLENEVKDFFNRNQYCWSTIEYQNDSRQHVLGYPKEKVVEIEKILMKL